MTDVVLSVNQVSKRFCRSLKRSLFYGIQDIATEVLGLSRDVEQLRPQEFWALKDVSLELRRGEAVGLVGANGAGKTTLLRIISGLIKPDRGSVEIRGRVAPLIALGAGFNPILTGRENIYVNMSILGLSKQEIEDRFEQVIEFAEIGEAIDSPVQSYSSGMAARLGFASAIFTEPDILLVDEVLAVGDAQFQAKCTRKLAELRTKSVSFIMVSHSASTLLSCCQQAVYLKSGFVKQIGAARVVIPAYELELFSKKLGTSYGKKSITPKKRELSSGLDIIYVLFRDNTGNPIESPTTGEELSLCIGCMAHSEFEKLIPFISFYDLERRSNLVDNTVLQIGSNFDNHFLKGENDLFELRLSFNPLLLAPGKYVANIGIHEGLLPNGLDVCPDFLFEVKPPSFAFPMDRNVFFQPRSWSCFPILDSDICNDISNKV
jgi:lipopolysaccharide transport system ATP-binding protein